MVGVCANCISLPKGGVWERGVAESEDRRLNREREQGGSLTGVGGREFGAFSAITGVLPLELWEVGGAW